MVFAISCGDDDNPPAPTFTDPTVSAPSPSDLESGATGTATFTVTVDSDLTATWSAASTGGLTLDATSGDVSGGTVEVGYTTSDAGAASITLTVTDSEEQTANATAVYTVLEEGNTVPTISGIPPNATVAQGETLSVPDVTLAADDGLGVLTVSLDGTDIPELGQDLSAAGTSVTVPLFEAPQTAGLAAGTYTIVFTLTDADGDATTATHSLIVTGTTNTFTVIDATESRGPDEGIETEYPQNEVTGIINVDYTFTKDKVWVLNGRVIVDAGATLTIEPGTIIKGAPGQGALSSVLLVAVGATIIADGTAEEPIVFTALEDNINVAGLPYFDNAAAAIVENGDGFTNSTLDVDLDIGKWGGLIVLGDAPISSGDGETTAIEGIPSSVPQAIYGGTDAADNSGIIRYVSIRFTGTQLGPGNELQGLTLGGVGTGTVVDHVESIASADDGTEIFGGTVNVTNFIVWGQEDDGYDTDQAWTGTVDNFVYLGTNEKADHAFELDGPEGDATGVGNFINGTVWGAKSSGMADLRDDSEHTLMNVFFFNFEGSADIELDQGDEDAPDYSNSINYIETETTNFTGLQFRNNSRTTLADLMDAKGNDTNNFASLGDVKFAEAANNNKVLGDTEAPTVGADLTDLGWSFTAQTFAGWSSIPSVTNQ